MAARNIVFGSGNGNKEIDMIDVGAITLLPILSAMLFEVWSLTINVFGGYDFTQSLWDIGGTAISPALLIVLACVAWIFSTNILNDETEMGQYEMGAVVTALLLPLLYVFVPAVADLVNASDLLKLAATLYVSAASVFISYIG